MLITGPQYFCDCCQRAIVDIHDGVGLWRPLKPELANDAADLMIVHRGCKHESLVHMLLPQRSARPLGELLSLADEAANR